MSAVKYSLYDKFLDLRNTIPKLLEIRNYSGNDVYTIASEDLPSNRFGGIMWGDETIDILIESGNLKKLNDNQANLINILYRKE